jgi:lipopolysaccharide transport system ATP-binding protein
MSLVDNIIEVDNLSKCYRIGIKDEIHDSMWMAFLNTLKSPLKNYRKYRSLYRFDNIHPNAPEEESVSDVIWALKNVSFEVKRGEALGIIGKNGSGKSTLLKILSKITNPTTGQAKFKGRIASLLEVGTGFHPELTGRENIYLNGTILGMTKKEVKRKFDEIVDFSGVEQFLDTPVKRYSSGMSVRLAFAVAAHLEPEILLVDEVLAVGDAEFQKKCLGKMGSVAKGGRTVLLVSHNMGSIAHLCERVLWLHEGKLQLIGPAADVVSTYLSEGVASQSNWQAEGSGSKDLDVKIQSVRIFSSNQQSTSTIEFTNPFNIEISYQINRPIRNLSIVFRVIDSIGSVVFESMDTDSTEWRGQLRNSGVYSSKCKIPEKLIRPGRYRLTVVSFVERIKTIECLEDVLQFDISEVGYRFNAKRFGAVTPELEWQINRADDEDRIQHRQSVV